MKQNLSVNKKVIQKKIIKKTNSNMDLSLKLFLAPFELFV